MKVQIPCNNVWNANMRDMPEAWEDNGYCYDSKPKR